MSAFIKGFMLSNIIMQLHVPDTDIITTLIHGQSAHCAVVLPNTSPLAHFGVVALKRVAMGRVARKMDPELQVHLQRRHQYAF